MWTMKLISIFLHILTLSTEIYAARRQLRTKATKSPTASPTITPTASPSEFPTSTPTASPSTGPSISPSSSHSTLVSEYYWNKSAKFRAFDGEGKDYFGWSVSVSGNIAIVGARFNGENVRSGSAYIIEKDESTGSWNWMAKLSPTDGAVGNCFGCSVSIFANIAIVGARCDNKLASYAGSAYVFEREDVTGRWDQKAKLTASDGAADDYFGTSVSVSSNTAVVGAFRDDVDGARSGSAYVFELDKSTGHWNQTAKLTASDGAEYDNFGLSVSNSGNIAIVGAPNDDDNGFRSGSAYVFEKDGSTGHWNQTAKLTAPDGTENDVFGTSVSVSSNTAVVGAHGDGACTGSAYVFEKDESSGHWNQTAKLTAPNCANCFFGYSVSVSGKTAIVGALHVDDNGRRSGSAYVFERDESTDFWNQTAKIIAPDGERYDCFGASVAVSGNSVIVGAFGDDSLSGSVYAFERTPVIS